MASLKQAAKELLVAEQSLAELYRALRGAAVTAVEQELASTLADLQKQQLAYLELLGDELPARFLGFGTICSQAVKLREGPGGNHRLLAELRAGTPIILLDWNGYWAHIQLPGGRQGYVFRDYVQVERRAAADAPAWQRPANG